MNNKQAYNLKKHKNIIIILHHYRCLTASVFCLYRQQADLEQEEISNTFSLRLRRGDSMPCQRSFPLLSKNSIAHLRPLVPTASKSQLFPMPIFFWRPSCQNPNPVRRSTPAILCATSNMSSIPSTPQCIHTGFWDMPFTPRPERPSSSMRLFML